MASIYKVLTELSREIDIFIREKAFSRFVRETQAISKVVGISDMTAWQNCQAVYYEISPTTVKRIITGSGKSEKHIVASALEPYVGRHAYATDDESDAVAVGIAWLINSGLLQSKK